MRKLAAGCFWLMFLVVGILSSQLRWQPSKNRIEFCDERSVSKICGLHSILSNSE